MENGRVFAKIVIFLLNGLCSVFGFLHIGYGSFVLQQSKAFETSHIALIFNGLLIVIIVSGCINIIFTMLGCSGLMTVNFRFTIIYFVSMFGIFIFQLILLLYVLIYHDSNISSINDSVGDIWDNRSINPKEMDLIQITFNCCGLKGPKDYSSETLPPSCCGLNNTYCKFPYEQGCESATISFYIYNFIILCIGGLCVAAIEFVSLICYYMLCKEM